MVGQWSRHQPKYCFVHHPKAIEAILYLMCMAVKLMQLFIFKRLSGVGIKEFTQKEVVRLLVKALYSIRYNREYFLDTT